MCLEKVGELVQEREVKQNMRIKDWLTALNLPHLEDKFKKNKLTWLSQLSEEEILDQLEIEDPVDL